MDGVDPQISNWPVTAQVLQKPESLHLYAQPDSTWPFNVQHSRIVLIIAIFICGKAYLPAPVLQQAVSTVMPTQERGTPVASPAATAFLSSSTAKPQRVLACVLCQQRKVKCDRKFPCSNCVRSHAQCVPAATLAPRQRRRRFPERELLDRLRRYESLLRQNEIKFEPLHKHPSTIEKQSRNAGGRGGYDSPDDEQPGGVAGPNPSSSPSTTGKSEIVYKAKYALTLEESYISR